MEWELNAILYALGAAGLFSARAFLPAFLTALMMRYGDRLPFLGDVEFLQATGREPSWFTSNWTILALGVLALAEVAASKSPDLEEWMAAGYKWAKSGVAALTMLGVLQSGDAEFIEDIIPVAQAGFVDTALSVCLAAAVWMLASLRNGFMSLVAMADPDGVLGIRTLLSWFEDIWAGIGMIFLFLYPVGMAILIVAVMAALWATAKWHELRDEKSKRPCAACGEPVFPSALHCPECDARHEEACAIGFFGQALDRPAGDRGATALRLAEKKRCPRCATRLTRRATDQECPACGRRPFAGAAFVSDYDKGIVARLPKVLGISALFSLVPVLGLIPGVIYYRIALVAPFIGYLPAGRSLLLKILLKITLLLLIALQIVPGAGIVAVPLMALLSYGLYRSAWRASVSG
ncbi:MAG: DUF4126 family protein [Opitutales bacterium]|nr:DUF4126 family protein [Opitutales bacterium]